MKKGPARIRVSLSRELSHAEKEFIRSLGKDYYIRLSGSGKLYIDSWVADSRELFDGAREWLEDNFVNVFPTAVRTFRELVK